MASESRATAFTADKMFDTLWWRRDRAFTRAVNISNEGGFYRGEWPAWDPEIRAAGGSPSLATASIVSGFQPDPDDPDSRVGHTAVAWLELFFDTGCSVGTGTFGFTLPRRPAAGDGALLGHFSGQADSSPSLPVSGVCLYSTLGGDDVVVMAMRSGGLLSNSNPGTWDMTSAYLLLSLMYEVEADESS